MARARRQHLPVRLAGDAREVGRHGDDARSVQREDAVELGEAKVVADGQAEPDPVRRLRHHELLGRLGVLGLAVLDATHLDVEHVDLAVDRLDLAVWPRVQARVGHALVALAPLRDRAGHQVDAELSAEPAGPAGDAAIDYLRLGRVLLGRASDVEALGQNDEIGAVVGGSPDQPLGLIEVAIDIGGAFELDCRGAQSAPPHFID